MKKYNIRGYVMPYLLIGIIFLSQSSHAASNNTNDDNQDKSININLYSKVDSSVSGTKTLDLEGNKETIVDLTSFTYKPGQYLQLYISLITNHTSIWFATEYAVTIEYHQFGYDQPLIETEGISYYTNQTRTQYYRTFANLGSVSRGIYITANILPGIADTSHIELNYEFLVISPPGNTVLDETKSYIANVSSFNNYFVIESSSWANDQSDRILFFVPNELRAMNETRVPEGYSYIFNAKITFAINDANDKRTTIQFKIDQDNQSKGNTDTIRVEGGGIFVASVSDLRIQKNHGLYEVIVQHSGEAIQLSILKIQLEIPALIDIPMAQTMPQWALAMASCLVVICGIISTTATFQYGKMRKKHAMENTSW